MIMSKKTDPIAVFDSGLGGISVLREIARVMPDEDVIYFGDSANAPYGTRDFAQVRRLTIAHITRMLRKEHCKAVAVACNTATSAAVKRLRELYPEVPLVGVEPAIKPAVNACDHPTVVVMATPMTLREEKFRNLEQIYLPRATIYPLPCPGLMEYVERGILSGAEIDAFLHQLLDPYKGKGVTGIVLGCTHYPFLKKAIRKVVDPSVSLFDGGYGTAKELKRRIEAAGLSRNEPAHPGKVTFTNSLKDPSILELSRRLFQWKDV